MFFNALYTIPFRTLKILNNLSIPAKVFWFLIGLFAPIAILIHMVILFLVIDMITAIYRQYKMTLRSLGKKPFVFRTALLFKTFRSSRAITTIEKLVFYSAAIILVFLMEKFVLHIDFNDGQPVGLMTITNISAGIILGIEFGSIMANISIITKNNVFLTIYKLMVSNVRNKTHVDIEEVDRIVNKDVDKEKD